MSDRDDELEEERVPGPDEHEDDDDLPPHEDDVDPPPLDADDEDPDDEEVVDEPRRENRGNRHFRELRRRAQSAEERARRAEEIALRAEGAASYRPPRDPEAERRAEAERLANMSAEERVDYRAQQVRNESTQRQAESEFRVMDRLDRTEFEALCGRNRAYAAVQKDVEDELKKLRSKGQNVDRKIIANVMIGERAAARAEKGGERAREQGERSRERQKSRAPRGGSDVVAPRSSSRTKGKNPRDRLDGVKF